MPAAPVIKTEVMWRNPDTTTGAGDKPAFDHHASAMPPWKILGSIGAPPPRCQMPPATRSGAQPKGPPSLRGGHRPHRHCEEAEGRRSNPVFLAAPGLLRLRLAMTDSGLTPRSPFRAPAAVGSS